MKQYQWEVEKLVCTSNKLADTYPAGIQILIHHKYGWPLKRWGGGERETLSLLKTCNENQHFMSWKKPAGVDLGSKIHLNGWLHFVLLESLSLWQNHSPCTHPSLVPSPHSLFEQCRREKTAATVCALLHYCQCYRQRWHNLPAIYIIYV